MHNTLTSRVVGADPARPYHLTLAAFSRSIARAADYISRLCWIFDYWIAERRYWGKR